MTMVMAVVFLLCLAMLGAWSLSSNALQERMAGNTRNRDLALQAAEAALKDAEFTISSWRTGTFNGTNGLFTYVATQANDKTYWQEPSRWTSYRSVPTGGLNQVAEAPKYVIEKMPNTANPSNAALFDVENYRITARAAGGDANAVVILQSIIQYVP
jgi:type IV pilus assembly protein PilX